MTKAERQEQLERLLLGLLPANGSTVANGQLLTLWTQAAADAGLLASPDDFASLRDDLVVRGLVVKGKGRGGSTARASAAAPGSDSFTLEGEAAAAAGDAGTAAVTSKAKPGKPKARAAGAGEEAQVLSYRHPDRRKNNPEVGLVSEASDPQQPKKAWAYNPHLDPVLNFDSARAELEGLIDEALESGDADAARAALQEIKRRGAPYLQWAGKAERTSFEVDTVSLHVHERIDPMSILSAVRKQMEEAKAKKAKGEEATALGRQASLFEAPFESLPLRAAVDFYRHDKGWANRLIAGDSLQVMNSLLVKEGMAGQVQMIYIDPPYGITYKSNFQPFVGKREVKDRNDADLTQEPEMVKAFRDTWELGVHSYLTYLRDRLLLAKELLSETGSVFVQISDVNVHHVRELLDDVFEPECFVAQIVIQKSGGFTKRTLPAIEDYLIWYSRSSGKVKYRDLREFDEHPPSDDSYYRRLQLPDGRWRWISKEEAEDRSRTEGEGRIFRHGPLNSDGPASTPKTFRFNGREFSCNPNRHWTVDPDHDMVRVAKSGHIFELGNDVAFKLYWDFNPAKSLSNVWLDTQSGGFNDEKVYVVQTTTKVIERCMLMTTDTGDLVLDPTCGSGTTAFVAEKWGRRWISCDTSRVAVTLAKQRLMTASYEYYELAYPHEGLKGGFIYKTVPHVTLKSIANNADIDAIYDRLHPAIEQALTALNVALGAHPPAEPLVVAEGVRKGEKLSFGKKGAALHEWEVPFPGDEGALQTVLPKGWPDALREPFEAFHTVRQRMQAEMDRSIAANAENETLFDQPEKSKTKLRITGPFSVEAVPFPTVLSLEAAEGGATTTPTEDQAYQTSIARSGETSRQQQWRDELLKTGIRGKGGQMLRFAELEVMAGTVCLHATGTLAETGERAVVSFGPEHGALEQRQVEHALNEAESLRPSPKFVVFCAFTFDPEAAKDIDETRWPGVNLLKAQMNTDLLTEDLKKARSSNQSFWLMGQPDVHLAELPDGRWQVEVNGFDYFDTARGELISGGKTKIAMWSLDTDYDGRSLFPHQVFFPMAGKDEGWRKLKKNIRAELDESLLDQFHGTVSLPFEAGKHGKAAVKIVDDRGIESLKILPLTARRQA
ncbi:MAG: site-specific DNA-methyltransferase [Burkholderiaceae bacterium]